MEFNVINMTATFIILGIFHYFLNSVVFSFSWNVLIFFFFPFIILFFILASFLFLFFFFPFPSHMLPFGWAVVLFHVHITWQVDKITFIIGWIKKWIYSYKRLNRQLISFWTWFLSLWFMKIITSLVFLKMITLSMLLMW